MVVDKTAVLTSYRGIDFSFNKLYYAETVIFKQGSY
jgi:hypothetical protein